MTSAASTLNEIPTAIDSCSEQNGRHWGVATTPIVGRRGHFEMRGSGMVGVFYGRFLSSHQPGEMRCLIFIGVARWGSFQP
jgi:hypothetical protein